MCSRVQRTIRQSTGSNILVIIMIYHIKETRLAQRFGSELLSDSGITTLGLGSETAEFNSMLHLHFLLLLDFSTTLMLHMLTFWSPACLATGTLRCSTTFTVSNDDTCQQTWCHAGWGRSNKSDTRAPVDPLRTVNLTRALRSIHSEDRHQSWCFVCGIGTRRCGRHGVSDTITSFYVCIYQSDSFIGRGMLLPIRMWHLFDFFYCVLLGFYWWLLVFCLVFRFGWLFSAVHKLL